MRLIDADDFKKFLQALCKVGAPYEEVIQLMDKQPTAYDVERIVEQFEEEINHCFVGSWEDYDEYEDGRSNAFERAIEIVKGGVDNAG